MHFCELGSKPLRKRSCLLILTSLLLAILSMPEEAKGKGSSLFEPTFTYVNGSTTSAGKAWCAKLANGRVVAVTALHLLGPDGGLPQQIPAPKASSMVKRVDFCTIGGAKQFSSTKVLTRTGSVDTSGLDHSGDVLFFEVNQDLASCAFGLAGKLPKLKDPVWVYTSTAGGQPQSYPAVVTGASNQMLIVQLYKPIALRACSGSPVLDKQGKVVGLLNAGFEGSGKLMCNPSTSILARINNDLKSAR